MPQQSSLNRLFSDESTNVVRYTELARPSRQVLWLTRTFITARLDYRRVEAACLALVPECSRAVLVLLCHLLLEASRHSVRRLKMAGPCHIAITDDEIRFLAALDLAQMQDPRLPGLLSSLYGNAECSARLMAILAATQKLGETLLQEGLRIETRHLLPVGQLPTIH